MSQRTPKDVPSIRDRLFVHEYLARNMNARQAAIAVGMKSPDVTACKLLKKPRVAEYLNKLTEAALNKTRIKAEDVIHELAIIGMGRVDDVIDYDKLTGGEEVNFRSKMEVGERTAMVKRVRIRKVPTIIINEKGKPERTYEKHIEMEFHDKKGCLELLGKHMELFTEKVDLTSGGEILKPIILPDNGRNRK